MSRLQSLGPLGALLALVLSGVPACSDGAVVNLGQRPELPPVEPTPERGGFGEAQPLSFTMGDDENPTLDSAMSVLYFNRGDVVDQGDPTQALHNVYRATWDSALQEFVDPQLVTILTPRELGSDYVVKYNNGAAITFDGSRLWLAWEHLDSNATASEFTSNIDVAVRSGSDSVFTFERRVSELNTPDHEERPRPLGQQGAVMPLARRLDSSGEPWATLFVSCDASAVCQNSETVLQLRFADGEDPEIVDGFLSEDGLLFAFKGILANQGDLYWTRRRSISEPWEEATVLPGLINTQEDERDPWLSPDAKTLYFARSDGIYRSEWVDELPEAAAPGN